MTTPTTDDVMREVGIIPDGILGVSREVRALADALRVAREREAKANDVFAWLLGENGDFPERPDRIEGKPYPFYWWRSELRKRINAITTTEPTR